MDINYIRQFPEKAKDNQLNRYNDVKIIDSILCIDDQWRTTNYKLDSIKKIRNILKKYFEKALETSSIIIDENYTLNTLFLDICSKNVDIKILSKIQLKLLGKLINDVISTLESDCTSLLINRDTSISTLGNFLHPDVTISNNEINNKIIFQHDISNDLINKKYNHIELCEKLKLVDSENGILVSGNRGYFLVGMGVRLSLALVNYALDFLEKRDYTLMYTPHIVNKNLMSKITQLNEYEETLYKLEGYDKYLVATSEQPLTAYFADKQLDSSSLPIKFAGISSCYRKETGKHGLQSRGIYRVHQFEKVEQFCVTNPNESWDMFYKIMDICKEFYDSLGIKYRIINIVSGALNNAASMKFDLEGYFAGNKNYGELVSCTNCLDYFSKRINTKINNTKEYVHMLNCTLMANTRVICCLLEQYQTEYGVDIPLVLQKYIGCDKILFK